MIRSAAIKVGLAARRAQSLLWAAAVAATAGCASKEPPPEYPPAFESALSWGDRTVAITYKDKDPVVAYFAPAVGDGGKMFVWDGGVDAIVQGDWRANGAGEVCMTLQVYRKQSTPPPPLRATEAFCTPLAGPLAGRFDYRGDVFDLNGKSDPPYILSSADNERIITVLADARRIAR